MQNALDAVFRKGSITPWLAAALVATTVDGASVLLSRPRDLLQQQAPNGLFFFCGTHRTQQVVFDLTQVATAE